MVTNIVSIWPSIPRAGVDIVWFGKRDNYRPVGIPVSPKIPVINKRFDLGNFLDLYFALPIMPNTQEKE